MAPKKVGALFGVHARTRSACHTGRCMNRDRGNGAHQALLASIKHVVLNESLHALYNAYLCPLSSSLHSADGCRRPPAAPRRMPRHAQRLRGAVRFLSGGCGRAGARAAAVAGGGQQAGEPEDD